MDRVGPAGVRAVIITGEQGSYGKQLTRERGNKHLAAPQFAERVAIAVDGAVKLPVGLEWVVLGCVDNIAGLNLEVVKKQLLILFDQPVTPARIAAGKWDRRANLVRIELRADALQAGRLPLP